MSNEIEKEHSVATIYSVWRSQLEERGYVVVPGIVPKERLEALEADMWRHTGADAHTPASWYRPRIIQATGMVEMYHYQSMWDNRQSPAVYQVFADIFGTEKLWVSLDRVNLKPPARPQYPEYDHKGFIHWDVDIAKYASLPFGVQGVLALTDTDENMGGFQCVPEIYQQLEAWVAGQPQGQQVSRHPDLSGYKITKVPLRAGDMVIWRTLLPHGNGYNLSERARLAQYITMFPAQPNSAPERQTRINSWLNNAPPPYPFYPGDPRKLEEKREKPANLTPLGRKLLGLDSWR